MKTNIYITLENGIVYKLRDASEVGFTVPKTDEPVEFHARAASWCKMNTSDFKDMLTDEEFFELIKTNVGEKETSPGMITAQCNHRYHSWDDDEMIPF